ncbi:uncharacterized protein F21D5.5-like [Planococcus citri]|uniref:uncharacterized protein F21D5.5-like n=1 Tax=Planococcus citri TaxID=170843 RepID=UPI0031F9205F
MDSNNSVTLRSVQNGSKCIKLNDGSVFQLGRNHDTQITDTRCSRVQLLVSADVKNCELVVEQVGNNPSAINGVKLKKGEKRKAVQGDIIEVLASDHLFKVEFPNSSRMESTKLDKIENGASPVKKTSKTSGTLDYFLKNSALKQVGCWECVTPDSLYVFSSDGIKSKEKIAAFDLDGTIITTLSGNVYPKDPNDWKIAYANVIEKLKELHGDDYKIVFFTNQGGISSGKLKVSDFKKKVEAIVRKINLPVQVFVAGRDDICRKPRPGMWNCLVKNKNDNIPVNYEESFFCGDAAGRPANCEPNKKKKDFSSSDRLFAINLNLKFYTPEEYFLGWKPAPFKLPEFYAKNLKDTSLLEPEGAKLTADSTEIIVMIGSPGSGKTFFSKTYLESAGYVHVNRDTLKTWQKCVKLTQQSVANKKSVIVDNTSPDKESRARYINVGKEFNVPVRAFWMNVSLHHAKHNNTFRKITDTTHEIIPNYSLNHFSMEPPDLSEGFTEIVRVNFVPKFNNDEEEKLYYTYLLD